MEIDRNDVVEKTRSLVDLTTRMKSNPASERTGGYLSMAIGGPQNMQSCKIGRVPDPSEWGVYKKFSQEKIYRATADWLRDPKTFSSWQTRDEKMERYGGAILLPNLDRDFPHAISFSGLKEHCDEAIALLIGQHLNLSSPEQVDRIIRYSNNRIYREMIEAFR